MGSKLLLLFSVLFVVGGVAFMTAFSLNALPPSIYTYTYQIFSFGPPRSEYPYLTKFEGHWQTELTPTIAQTELASCAPRSGILIIHNGQVTGTPGGLNDYLSVTAVVDQEGNLVGKTVRGGSGNDGTITGTIVKTDGNGVWADMLGCKGTFTMHKIDLYEDPSKGILTSYTGEVTLIRDGASRLPVPGEPIYVGDEIDVPDGGEAYLSIGFQTTNIPGGQKYVVKE